MSDFNTPELPDNIELHTKSDFGDESEVTIGAATNNMSNPPTFKFNNSDSNNASGGSGSQNEKYLKKEFDGPTTLDEPVLDTIVSISKVQTANF